MVGQYFTICHPFIYVTLLISVTQKQRILGMIFAYIQHFVL